MNLPQTANVQPSAGHGNYAVLVKGTITDCVEQLRIVTSETGEIQTQGGWARYWSKGKNIQDLATYVETLASIQQRSFDLTVLLMGAAGRMKQDYNIILESIEQLNDSYEGNNEILDYLVRVKTMVADVQVQSERYEQLQASQDALALRCEQLEEQNKALVESCMRLEAAVHSGSVPKHAGKKQSYVKWIAVGLVILWIIGALLS